MLVVSGAGAWLIDRELQHRETDEFVPPGNQGTSSVQARTTLPVGSPAPDLNVPALDGECTFHLADYSGSKPVVLIFGSFT
jgi:hypothetical protein